MLRTDIQALRGFAVLLVLFHHARIGGLVSGYLGVDIFFVVSGFLITGIVKRQIEDGTFSLTKFYFRRAKRLLPAAYVTFAITLVAAPFFLSAVAQNDLAKQTIGAISFTANIVLWLQTGYFEELAALKPLLHVWSLSIEEQYYLILPLTLIMIPRRRWPIACLLMLTASLVACLVAVSSRPSATFYLLPTRAWELAMGSAGALVPIVLSKRASNALQWLLWPAVATLVLIPALPPIGPHPGLGAIAVCAATLVILLRRFGLLNRGLIPLALARVGGMSYSLYLVHWPLFAYANNAYVTPIPVGVRVSLIGLSIVLAYLLYRYVESPVRNADVRPSSKAIGVVVTVSLLFVAAALATGSWFANSPSPASDPRRANVGLHYSCVAGATFSPSPICQTNDRPRILLWGDSYAMHLAEGIRSTASGGFVQATKEVCGPMLGIAPFSISSAYTRKWAESCFTFNDSVLRYLEGNTEIDTVILASAFSQYVGGDELGTSFHLSTSLSEMTIRDDERFEATVMALKKTIDSLRHAGKRVVVIAPPPRGAFDVGRCLDRLAASKVLMGSPDPTCRIPVSTHLRERAVIDHLLSRVAAEANVAVIDFADALCDQQFCQTRLGDTPLYRDGGHLSYDGSRALAQHLNLGSLIRQMAN